MKKLIFYRVQRVEVPLLREPNTIEEYILLAKDDNATMFDVSEGLLEFEKEEVIDEDYSSGITVNIKKPIIEEVK